MARAPAPAPAPGVWQVKLGQEFRPYDDDVQQALEAAFNNNTPFVPTAITVRGQKYNVSRSASGGFEQTLATDRTKVRQVRRVAPPAADPPPAAAAAAPTPPAKRPRHEAPPTLDDDDDDDFANFDVDAAVAAHEKAKTPPHASVAAKPSNSGGGASSSAAAAMALPPSTGPPRDVCDHPAWHARLTASFLTPFNDDIFDLFYLSQAEHPSTLKNAGITLLAPFKLLSGDLSTANALSDRGLYDPPEFQPLVKLVETNGTTAVIGYWRDEPAEHATLLAISRPKDTGKGGGPGVNITPIDNPPGGQAHLFIALHVLMTKASKESSLKGQACGRFANALAASAAANGVEMSPASNFKAGSLASQRKRAAIGPTVSGMGIIVPYDKPTELGYRVLHITGKELRKLLDEFVKAKDDPKAKAKPQAELDDLINWANIANDESDFGASLQLGQDLFNHDLTFAPLAGRTLSMAYTLLDREVFAEIAGMHVGKRKQQ